MYTQNFNKQDDRNNYNYTNIFGVTLKKVNVQHKNPSEGIENDGKPIPFTDIKETYAPREESLDVVETTRHVSNISLYTREPDTNDIGYQPPIPDSEVRAPTSPRSFSRGERRSGLGGRRVRRREYGGSRYRGRRRVNREPRTEAHENEKPAETTVSTPTNTNTRDKPLTKQNILDHEKNEEKEVSQKKESILNQQKYEKKVSQKGSILDKPSYKSLVCLLDNQNRQFNRPLPNIKIERKNCSVCMEDYPKSQFRSPTSKCNHIFDICRNCIVSYLSYEVTSTVIDIKCININCSQFFQSESDFQERKDLFNRWGDLKFINSIQKDPFFRWCSRPDCGNGGFIKENDSFFNCEKCKQRTCVHHRIVFHDGITCKQYDEMIQNQDQEMITDVLKYKQCPSCKYFIEKNDGCDHMKCKCGYEFCYLCLADFNEIRKHGNHKHNNSCLHYRDWDERMVRRDYYNYYDNDDSDNSDDESE